MKRKLLLCAITAASALCLACGIAACGGKEEKKIGLAYEYNGERGAYAVTGIENLPSKAEVEKDPTLTRPTEIVVPGSYRNRPVFVESNAFSGYDFVETLILEEGVLTVDDGAFAGCTALASVTLPASLTGIGAGAFTNCTALTELLLPAGVSAVGDEAFYGCTALKEIDAAAGNASFSSLDGVLYDAAKTQIVCAPLALEGEITIPGSVATVKASAFRGCGKLEKVTLSSGTTAVGTSAFAECDSLKSVELCDTLKTIDEGAFSGCVSLSEIAFPATLEKIGLSAFFGCTSLTAVSVPDHVTELGARAFSDCSGLISASLPAGLGEISRELFRNCGKLASLEIPDSVAAIGDYAFMNCVSLPSIRISANLKTIGERAFFGCSALTSVEADPANERYYGNGAGLCERASAGDILLYGVNAETVQVSDGVKEIAPYAFYFCDKIKEIQLPASVSAIGEWAFVGCSALERIAVAKENASFIGSDGILYRKDGENISFAHIPLSLKGTVEIPEGIEAIGEVAFRGCTQLQEIKLPVSLKTIGANAFEGCASLVSVSFPPAKAESPEQKQEEETKTETFKGIEIGASAFLDCLALETFTIPDTETETSRIGDNAFRGCVSLRKVSLGNHVTWVGTNAFSGCDALEEFTVSKDNADYGSQDKILYNKSVAGLSDIFYVPMRISGKVVLPETLSKIEAAAFYGRALLTEITIPSGVVSIGSYAFFGCDSLAKVNYGGTEQQWKNLSKSAGNEPLRQAEFALYQAQK